jgi:glycosyltransferase involved in cell wall biosynthesis
MRSAINKPKTVFYLREVSSRLDSGMSLQVIHDYGNLSLRGYAVYVPFDGSSSDDSKRKLLEDYAFQNSFSNLRMVFTSNSSRRLRFVFMLLRYFFLMLKLPRRSTYVVIREIKYLAVAKLLRGFFGSVVVSELHEGGLPRENDKKSILRIKKLLASINGCVFTNLSQVAYLKACGIESPNKFIVLPNGVDTEKFARAVRQASDAYPKVITYTGQFTSWKNVPLLFSALSQLPQEYVLRIAGGKENLKEASKYINELAVKHGVVDRVRYVGFLHPSRIVDDALSGSAVLVVPLGTGVTAQWATSPMKLVEYLATPIPIVAVNAPSTESLSGPGTIHWSTMDPNDFARAIVRATKEDPASVAVRMQNSNTIAKLYDHKIRAKRFDDWLTYLIA